EYETMFMMTNTKYSYISSSMVKELAGFHGDLTGLVPCEIIETIEEKYK
ncbi:MAG TPA: pantetheine-phosphate adenylyltransferase, partial [Clostridiales bacterium]|nr:pantetheine-phosphate adenylyltransferase [Clostridiales bacterium]